VNREGREGGREREKKIGKRTRKKSVRLLVVLVEHPATRTDKGDREKAGTCGLKVVVLDEMTTMLVVAANAEKKTRLPENNHNGIHTHIHTHKGLSSSSL